MCLCHGADGAPSLGLLSVPVMCVCAMVLTALPLGRQILRLDPRRPEEVEVVANTTAASGVDYHFQKGMLFWSDTDTRKVRGWASGRREAAGGKRQAGGRRAAGSRQAAGGRRRAIGGRR